MVIGTACPNHRPPKQHTARRLVEQRYDWQQIGQKFVALVEETGQVRLTQRE